jgi:hypothetical protein
MSITEYVYSAAALRRRCHRCEYFKTDSPGEWLYGTCVCKTNKVRDKRRTALSRACVWKKTKPEDEQ